MPVSVATRIFRRSSIESFAIALAITRHHGFKRLDFCQVRLFLHDHGHPIQTVEYLRVHRMLDPERAVLVKGGNTLFLRHKTAARLVSGRLNEFGYRLLGGPVVP
jgi:hypothetical protein